MTLLEKNSKFLYPSAMFSKSSEKREEFFELLNYLKSNSVETTHRYSGSFYSEFTYHLPNGEVYVYTEDDFQGIPYSIENVTQEKEDERER